MKMESLIHTIQAESCPMAWLQAVEYLIGLPSREAHNLVLGRRGTSRNDPA